MFLQHKNIQINEKAKTGDTALMNASFNGHKEIVEMLLQDKRIEINQQDKFGLTYCINLKCGHSFYRKPLVTWAEKCKECPTCPICRKSFKVIFCHMIIFNHNNGINSRLHFMKVE